MDGEGMTGALLLSLTVAIAACILAALVSCAPRQVVSSGTDARDSVRVETITERRVVYDTVDIEIPAMAAERFTPDTVSVLRNEVAESEAEVSGGMLRHTLRSRPQIRRQAVAREIVTRDSIVYRDKVRETTVTVEVARKPGLWHRLWHWMPLVLAVVAFRPWRWLGKIKGLARLF